MVRPLRCRPLSERIQLRIVMLTERMTGRKQIFHTAKNAHHYPFGGTCYLYALVKRLLQKHELRLALENTEWLWLV